jgi:hypothetical protein
MLEFQREKQSRLNRVPVEVALRTSQVQLPLLDNGSMGAGFGHAGSLCAAAGAAAALEQTVVVPYSCLDCLAARAEVRTLLLCMCCACMGRVHVAG